MLESKLRELPSKIQRIARENGLIVKLDGASPLDIGEIQISDDPNDYNTLVIVNIGLLKYTNDYSRLIVAELLTDSGREYLKVDSRLERYQNLLPKFVDALMADKEIHQKIIFADIEKLYTKIKEAAKNNDLIAILDKHSLNFGLVIPHKTIIPGIPIAEIRLSDDYSKLSVIELSIRELDRELQYSYPNNLRKYGPSVKAIAQALDKDPEIVQEVMYMSRGPLA